jgi:hypothetical protein
MNNTIAISSLNSEGRFTVRYVFNCLYQQYKQYNLIQFILERRNFNKGTHICSPIFIRMKLIWQYLKPYKWWVVLSLLLAADRSADGT